MVVVAGETAVAPKLQEAGILLLLLRVVTGLTLEESKLVVVVAAIGPTLPLRLVRVGRCCQIQFGGEDTTQK
jgi:hypothetical protein